LHEYIQQRMSSKESLFKQLTAEITSQTVDGVHEQFTFQTYKNVVASFFPPKNYSSVEFHRCIIGKEIQYNFVQQEQCEVTPR
jgi:hypothetical protein